MELVRFIGLPRSVVNGVVGDMEGWRHLGERMLDAAREKCPVGKEGPEWQGPHLKDTLELRMISGEDPRILIGSKEKGEILAYVHDGTSEHDNVPKNASTLRWYDEDGNPVFRPFSHTPARPPNPFILDAARSMLGG